MADPIRDLVKAGRLEEALLMCLQGVGLDPICEYTFEPQRRWRFDFCFPSEGVGIEVEGGVWSGGRHTRGSGYEKDIEKYNAAAVRGWKVIRCTGRHIADGDALNWVQAALRASGREEGDARPD